MYYNIYKTLKFINVNVGGSKKNIIIITIFHLWFLCYDFPMEIENIIWACIIIITKYITEIKYVKPKNSAFASLLLKLFLLDE